tara:strand:+ start:615 stop:1178 length:564 start_codon:yes stop_codon:yes gene_type:complete
MNIGILGSSFNPVHKGHISIAKKAIKVFNLNQVWLMITNQNPLKKSNVYLEYNERIRLLKKVCNSKKLVIKNFENKSNSIFLVDNLHYIKKSFPKNNFIFLMGTDSFLEIDQWKDYEKLFKQMPLAVFNRYGTKKKSLSSKIATKYKKYRFDHKNKKDIFQSVPSWCLIDDFDIRVSSTSIRKISKN